MYAAINKNAMVAVFAKIIFMILVLDFVEREGLEPPTLNLFMLRNKPLYPLSYLSSLPVFPGCIENNKRIKN